jgi:ribosomal protein S19E (S16A)
VRTVSSQLRLARWNENAADATGDDRSSHLTGATIDISKRWMSPAGQEWIREVLYSLREAGYIYAIEEFYQPTFHIMVYPKYAQYVKTLKHRKERTPDLADAHVTPSAEAD